MMRKNLLPLSACLLLIATAAFAGMNLNLSKEIPVCTEEVITMYEDSSEPNIKAIVEELRVVEADLIIENEKPEKDWDSIKVLTQRAGELKGKLEYIVLSKN
ncbi:hypothetical protein [uncultured Ilyobacter sp.]|jgi:hypothetical protein|uniref:hypothetical protein n=1 Tax=uncultured Ilyobacter sp. TaxID=544433 RepID=UPI002AA719F8|nr:hypothetical protein [uncultured Ilyobacter sp.]